MNYHIYRTHVSGYWPKNFLELEKNCLQSAKLQYHGVVNAPERWLSPAIILSNTHFYPGKVPSDHWSKVKLILHANSGYDTLLDQGFWSNYQGPILIAPQLRATAVAEYNLRCWLTALGVIPFQRQWDNTRAYPRRLAETQKVLIIGYGSVGQKTLSYFKSLTPHVDVYDPYVKTQTPLATSIDWGKYDGIIFCCSLTQTSRKLLMDESWHALKSNVILINAARGDLWQTQQVISFAKHCPASQIYLDVYPQEPANDLSIYPSNVFCSSHIAGVHDELLQQTLQWQKTAIADFQQQSVTEFLAKRPMENLRLKRLDL